MFTLSNVNIFLNENLTTHPLKYVLVFNVSEHGYRIIKLPFSFLRFHVLLPTLLKYHVAIFAYLWLCKKLLLFYFYTTLEIGINLLHTQGVEKEACFLNLVIKF